MIPVVVLVGRPNVGKSTLFNRLTRSRDAIVFDYPGLTRDRHYGHGRGAGRPYLVVDTGGFEPKTKTGIMAAMAKQTRQAMDEADVIVFLVDAREGLHPEDRTIAELVRKSGRTYLLAVNKAEGMQRERVASEFYELGLGEPLPISSAHGENVSSLIEVALEGFRPDEDEADAANDWEAGATDPGLAAEPAGRKTRGAASRNRTRADVAAAALAAAKASEAAAAPGAEPGGTAAAPSAPQQFIPSKPKIAIVGRPNVGKSTLVNTLLGEERVIAFDEPGTTRDSIHLDFERGGKTYTLIDTAGVRRRGKVTEAIEKFSVIKTLQAIEDANVVVLLLDARQEISEQDAHIAGFILDAGRALVVAVNKWDNLPVDQREQVKRELDRKLQFLSFARWHFISAKDGTGINQLFTSVQQAYAAAHAKLPTPRLTRALQMAVQRQQPPRDGAGRPKLRYAHQGGMNPPIVVIHGSALHAIPTSYKRYLEHFFVDEFELRGTPLVVQFKSGHNPFAGRPKRSH